MKTPDYTQELLDKMKGDGSLNSSLLDSLASKLAEATTTIRLVAEAFHDGDIEEVLETIRQSIQYDHLIKSGMKSEEALDLLGVKRNV